MDLGFFRRSQAAFANRGAAQLDYRVLVATLEAMQSASATARSLRSSGGTAATTSGHDPLVELLVGGAGWRDAVGALGGCFNRGQVKFLATRP
jgi:hypothetical protein